MTGIGLAGLDLAWKTAKNGSGVAIGTLRQNNLSIRRVLTGVIGLQAIQSAIDQAGDVRGIAVDAPLIIHNQTGSRQCERDLGAVFHARWAGCHPSNLTRMPDADSVRLGHWLAAREFRHLGKPGDGRWQVECYPHPAIIEIFRLPKRHAYKKGRVTARRSGQMELARMIRTLERHPLLSLTAACPQAHEVTSEDHIAQLAGRDLKYNEDGLDAILCLYIAGLYAIGHPQNVFGEAESGYIVVPTALPPPAGG